MDVFYNTLEQARSQGLESVSQSIGNLESQATSTGHQLKKLRWMNSDDEGQKPNQEKVNVKLGPKTLTNFSETQSSHYDSRVNNDDIEEEITFTKQRQARSSAKKKKLMILSSEEEDDDQDEDDDFFLDEYASDD